MNQTVVRPEGFERGDGKVEMKTVKSTILFAATSMFLLLVLFGAGCASPNVNPSAPRAGTGYVDFYAPQNDGLAWQVQRFEPKADRFKTVFSDVMPLKDSVLRLAFAPGQYRFEVTFLNRVVAQPAQLNVNVETGRVVPVCVTLTETGATYAETRNKTYGSNIHGRIGRRTKVGSDETVMWQATAAAQPSVPYQPKERMPYAQTLAQ